MHPHRPRPRVLVAFASRHGATREIAATVVRCLVDRGVDRDLGVFAVLAPVQRCPDPRRFDAVVLGSALYDGRWLEPARRYAESMGEELRDRPTWLFSSGVLAGMHGAGEDRDEGQRMASLVGARAHRLFAGRLERRLLSSAERAVWRGGSGGAGDFRDWSAVGEWSCQIADDLAGRFSLPLPGMTA
jgi:menaquinone-dependent protoporphyrinogen oxidase